MTQGTDRDEGNAANGCGSPYSFTFSEAIAAIDRERETRHWTIAQRREAFGVRWPHETAEITARADAAADWLVHSLRQLRDAWNAHFAACPSPAPDVPAPTWEQLNEWANAPSDTASGS